VVAWLQLVRVVPEHHVELVERLGKYHRTLEPGRHMLIPGIEAVRTRLDLRRQALDVATVAYTADNELVAVDAAVEFDIVDPVRAVYDISDHRQALEQAVITVLRNELGVETGQDLRSQINERTAGFGIEVTEVNVTTTALPAEEAEAIRARARDNLRRPGFAVVLRGYDRQQVDDVLRRAIEGFSSDRPDLRAAAAQALWEPLRVRFRGYSRQQVDRHLALIRRVSV